MTKAIDSYITRLEQSRKHLERISQFIDDNGEVLPDDVNWQDVGGIAYIATELQELERFINSISEVA